MKKIIFIAFGIVFSFASMVSAQASELIQYDLRVDGMTCPFCLATSEKALKKLQGVQYISSNLDTATISVCGPNSLEFDDTELSDLFKTKGFTYRGLEKLTSCSLLNSDGAPKKASVETQQHAQSSGHSAGHSAGHSHE